MKLACIILAVLGATAVTPLQAQDVAAPRPWLGPYAAKIAPAKHVRKCSDATSCGPIDEVFYTCMAAGNSANRYFSKTRSLAPLPTEKLQKIVAEIIMEDDFCERRSGEGDVNLRRIVEGWERRRPGL